MREARRGQTIIEVLVAFVALLGGLLGFARSIVGSMQTSETSHQAAMAREAARMQIEEMRSLPLSQVFATYNSDPNDDPGGVGTAQGPDFAVVGLSVADDDADGFAGEIFLPEVEGAAGTLREDMVAKRLGLPRDLSGDGVIDALDHSGDYMLLPVVVRVEWRTSNSTGRVELRTMLGNFQ